MPGFDGGCKEKILSRRFGQWRRLLSYYFITVCGIERIMRSVHDNLFSDMDSGDKPEAESQQQEEVGPAIELLPDNDR